MPIRESYTTRTTQTSASQIIGSLESDVDFSEEDDPGSSLNVVAVPTVAIIKMERFCKRHRSILLCILCPGR